jgi:serine/threonine-protein kinase
VVFFVERSGQLAFEPGNTVDRFLIEAELGKGGMGQVFRAYDTRLHRRVALKVVLPDASVSPARATEARARFLREARAAAAFDHPNVVAIFDLGEIDGVAYISMEYVPGPSLRDFVGDASTPWARKLRWLVDVALALGAAHRAGLVHRDVKPENVVLAEGELVKVLDFGVARRVSTTVGEGSDPLGSHGVSTITQEGVVVGTPLYMAPEQIQGEPVDGRADQFAWGVMAYELLAGAPPWSAPGMMALMAAILTQPLPKLPESIGVPPAAEAAIARALSKRPGDRFATMEELSAAI